METKQKKSPVFTLTLVENGVAGAGERADEVVIGVGPAFDKFQHQTLIDMPHKAIIKELVAGVEEEGLHARVVRILRTSDVSFMNNVLSVISNESGKSQRLGDWNRYPV